MMTRETKAGLIVTASFLGLLGAVITKKIMEPAPSAEKDAAKEVQVASNDKKNASVTPVSPTNMDLLPVPSKEGIVLTNGEEKKAAEPEKPGLPPLPPPEPSAGGIPPLPGSVPADKSGIPPLPMETPKAELPPLPGSIPPPPLSPAETPKPGDVSIPPVPSTGAPAPVIPPPLPAPVGVKEMKEPPAPSPVIPPVPSPATETKNPLAPLPAVPPTGLGGTPPPPVPSIPAPTAPSVPPLGSGAGAITPPPPPPPAPGFDATAPAALSSTSPMPKVSSTTFNSNTGPGVRSEFIPSAGAHVPMGNMSAVPGGPIAPIPASGPVATPANPSQIISAPPIPGTTPVPITPSPGAVLSVPPNNATGPFGTPANGATMPSAPIPSAAPLAPVAPPAAPPAASLAPPRVESWSEQTYVATPGDTYDSISQKIYRSPDYAKALQMWNENHPRARFDAPKNGLIVPGQEIYYPPTTELARRFGNAMPKVTPVGATGK